MLNELRDLVRCLEKTGVEQLGDLHPNFKPCPRSSKSLWVYVGVNGQIKDAELVPDDIDVTSIRKWEKSAGCSFPSFNLPPLLKITNEEASGLAKTFKRGLGQNKPVDREVVNRILFNSNTLWEYKDKVRINNCLSRAVSEIEDQFGDVPSECMALQIVCQRTKTISADSLHKQLADVLAKKILASGSKTASDMFDMLSFYAGDKPKNFQVIFELDHTDLSVLGLEYPAYHRTVQNWMNSQFLIHSKTQLKDTTELDAFGENAAGKKDKFPPVRLPVLGDVILRAMSSESPCQKRYGMIDSESFPAGDSIRKGMKSALEWLAASERKSKTWANLASKMEKPTILFAYPSELQSVPELAGMLGVGDEATNGEASFAAIAERVTKTLLGMSEGKPDIDVHIFALTKVDKARTKVIVSKRFTADHMIEAAERWQNGCRNIPSIKIKQFGANKGDKTLWAASLIPFPGEVLWCLNTAWLRQGTYVEVVHGFSLGDVLGLLLDDGVEIRRLATRAIDAVVRNSVGLLLAIGQENIKNNVFKLNKNYAKQALLLPSILGLLLNKIGFDKGGIMESPAFLIGKFLSFADELHLKYCEQVRKGSIPPQLVGNALMPTALETPVKALSMLSQRILPYQAWAKTLKGAGKDVGLIKYFLHQFGDVSNQLDNIQIPQNCTESDKAQMLLGYLARKEKSEE